MALQCSCLMVLLASPAAVELSIINSDGFLGMIHFSEGGTKRAGLFAVVEEGMKFDFGCRGENRSHDMTMNMNSPIVGHWSCRSRARGEVGVYSCSGLGLADL
jgi:hypothetical protein